MKSTILVIIPLVFWSTLYWLDLRLGVAVGVTAPKAELTIGANEAKLTVATGQNLLIYSMIG
jgi:hypothetical protein